MDIRLKAKLSAYSLVDMAEDDHVCPTINPVTQDQIDQLFTKEDSGYQQPDKAFRSFVDSLFEKGSTDV